MAPGRRHRRPRRAGGRRAGHDPARRGARALAAARAKYQAGGYDAARGLLDAAELTPLDERQRARAGLLRGRIMSAARSAGTALPLLLRAARRLEPLARGWPRRPTATRSTRP
ncbi:outer membrane PBP1 activator LpoA protein [Nonomuraea thailandensis]|uniref:Outer membrane PBP1 activator LpoA protein n=1 Tax=Nonomuraea thailandensis TaxID=1188745 RepID=A0A9X2GBL2_9ACTN|nr:hypothetical protein [Nonomuraea thailandensis]MCP2355982.1 outer membrane PBP1 activator LpoA protein [Nonomuraea thailandensis]